MNLKHVSFSLLFYLLNQMNPCIGESITFINAERPEVTYYDPKCFNKLVAMSRRNTREDPRHYLELYVDAKIPMNNTIRMDFFFYQFLTNRYRPSFVEMHFKLCDMINFDPFFGKTMRLALAGRRCPLPAGLYDLKNLSISYVPRGFPFSSGRIYVNVSLTEGGAERRIASGNIDMEVKVGKVKRKINNP